MRVIITSLAALPGQTLAPGVQAEVDDATAAWLIDQGAAQALDQRPVSVTSNPVLDGTLDVPPAPPRKRARQEA